MKWFTLDKKCDLCGICGPSVLAIDHGEKRLYMCSTQWNDWLHTLFGDDPDSGIEQHLIHPDACESHPTEP